MAEAIRTKRKVTPVRRPPADAGTVAQTGHRYVSLLGLRDFETTHLLRRIQQGLPYRVWDTFLSNTSLPRDAVAAAIAIPPRTLTRRKEEGYLHPDESDRLARVARLFALATELFEGDALSARDWFTAAQSALGGAAPLAYAATEIGAREVEALIGRLEHGIPS